MSKQAINIYEIFAQMVYRVTDKGLEMAKEMLSDSDYDKRNDFFAPWHLKKSMDFIAALANTPGDGSALAESLLETPEAMEAMFRSDFRNKAMLTLKNTSLERKIALFNSPGLLSAAISARYGEEIMDIVESAPFKDQVSLLGPIALYPMIIGHTEQVIRILESKAPETWSEALSPESKEMLNDYNFGRFINPAKSTLNLTGPATPAND